MPAGNSDMLIGFAIDRIFLIRFRTRLLGLSDNQNQSADWSSQWKPPKQVKALTTSFRSHASDLTLRTSATTLESVAIPQRPMMRRVIRTIISTDGIPGGGTDRSTLT